MKRFIPLLLLSCPVMAEELPFKIGGFIDTYYAFDSNMPKDHERQFTTQPARHNEVNVNLAYIDATLKKDKTRGRLALQYGNSVTKNYSGEQSNGATANVQDSKVMQEAYVGTKIGPHTWIDLGIFLGHIGYESWISKDNWTYTRSLNSEYVPYYSSGVRIEHALTSSQTLQIQFLNGWQNISETNQGKAVAMQYKNVLNDRMTFAYNNFFGDEEVVPHTNSGSTRPRFRSYHNVYLQHALSDRWQYIFSFDVGHQSQQANKGVDPWYNTTFTLRQSLNETQSLTYRAEYYNDRHNTNVPTGTPSGFQIIGGSINFDQKLEENALWRTEFRSLYSKDKIFPKKTSEESRLDNVIVTSLSVWF